MIKWIGIGAVAIFVGAFLLVGQAADDIAENLRAEIVENVFLNERIDELEREQKILREMLGCVKVSRNFIENGLGLIEEEGDDDSTSG